MGILSRLIFNLSIIWIIKRYPFDFGVCSINWKTIKIELEVCGTAIVPRLILQNVIHPTA